MARRKKAGWWPMFVAVVLAFVSGLVLVVFFSQRLFQAPEKPAAPEYLEIDIYMSNARGDGLEPVRRRIRKGPIESELREALEILIQGGNGRGTIPEGTRLLSVELKGGVLYVDLSRELIERHRGGTSGELLTVYSIVNTATLNFPGVRKVQLLVEGRKEETIAGHIDISVPIGPVRGVKTSATVG